MPAAVRRAINVSLSADLVEEAKALKVNISRACEHGLKAEVGKSRAESWIEENRPAMEAWNRWIEKNGMPYAEYREV